MTKEQKETLFAWFLPTIGVLFAVVVLWVAGRL